MPLTVRPDGAVRLAYGRQILLGAAEALAPETCELEKGLFDYEAMYMLRRTTFTPPVAVAVARG